MSKSRFVAYAFSIAMAVGIGASSQFGVLGASTEQGDALTITLVHPDRQAARVLTLFEGARSPHPAAALAGWKRATRDPNQLGKPLEAVISFFNPEMTPEWRVMDGTQIGFNVSAADGKPRWYAVVPRDDGTLSAGITAQRLTSGSPDLLLTVEGRGQSVERLGPIGGTVAAQIGETLIVGSSREELMRGLRRVNAAPARAAANEGDVINAEAMSTKASQIPFDSGLVFDLKPGMMSPDAGTIAIRRAVALLQGLRWQHIHGNLGLTGDRLTIELTTTRDRVDAAKQPTAKPPVAVEPAWLEWIPAADVMAAVSVALEPGESFWDSAFAVADRVERADPMRAGLAPLRARFNLLAAAAGARPEADLWPHLKGVTAGVIGGTDRPGRPIGAIVVLHTDAHSSAHRLVTDVLPRLESLLTAQGRGRPQVPAARQKPGGDGHFIARVGGRPLALSRRGPDVVISWGEEMQKAAQASVTRPDRSVASICDGWMRTGKIPPRRVGAIWPARCWPDSLGIDPTTPAWRVLAEGPPAIWWGWDEPTAAHDLIQFGDLRHRIHRFLEALPLDPSPLK